jgi:hypothetical protein
VSDGGLENILSAASTVVSGLKSGLAAGLGFKKKESGDSPLWFCFIVAEVLCL